MSNSMGVTVPLLVVCACSASIRQLVY